LRARLFTLSNFSLVDVGSAGTFSGTTWTVDRPSDNSAMLELIADVSVTTKQQPESRSGTGFARIFSTGLTALGFARRKRKAS
jgi:hypothetical protein